MGTNCFHVFFLFILKTWTLGSMQQRTVDVASQNMHFKDKRKGKRINIYR